MITLVKGMEYAKRYCQDCYCSYDIFYDNLCAFLERGERIAYFTEESAVTNYGQVIDFTEVI